MKDHRFIGTGVAIVTPFKNNEIDFPALARVIEHVISGGVQYIVVLGSTGETATLNETEARQVLDFCLEKINNRVPVVAGNFGGNDTKELVSKIKNYNFSGVSAILSSSPAYVKPSQEGIFRHYQAVSDVSPVPVILYNVPGRTRSNMEWTTTVRLAEYSKNIIGIKEASGDLIQTTRIIKNKPADFIVTSGDDEVALPMVCIGGDGVISVMANALPTPFSAMISAALQNNYERARTLNFATYDLHHWLYIEGNPVGIKSALEILGFCSNEVRLPLSPLSSENYSKLSEVLKKSKTIWQISDQIPWLGFIIIQNFWYNKFFVNLSFVNRLCMMTKSHFSLLFLFLSLLFFTCKNEMHDIDDTIHIRIEKDPERLHPLIFPNPLAREIYQYIFLPLADFNRETLELEPLLIKELPEKQIITEGPYSGGVRFDIEILPEAVWENGSPITAKDYIFTLKAIRLPLNNTSRYRDVLQNIVAVEMDKNNEKSFRSF
ncbi:MAG: 4-hydroxy-tetrahydrodipicolinate synthase [Saprospiraceae bacterium]|nr:4-hydroxy-tetrahydrodipicolinate synthase [Saprospiraceae bacterium]